MSFPKTRADGVDSASAQLRLRECDQSKRDAHGNSPRPHLLKRRPPAVLAACRSFHRHPENLNDRQPEENERHHEEVGAVDGEENANCSCHSRLVSSRHQNGWSSIEQTIDAAPASPVQYFWRQSRTLAHYQPYASPRGGVNRKRCASLSNQPVRSAERRRWCFPTFSAQFTTRSASSLPWGMFTIVAVDLAVQAFKAPQRGESRLQAVRVESRTFKVGIALAYGVIFLARSQFH